MALPVNDTCTWVKRVSFEGPGFSFLTTWSISLFSSVLTGVFAWRRKLHDSLKYSFEPARTWFGTSRTSCTRPNFVGDSFVGSCVVDGAQGVLLTASTRANFSFCKLWTLMPPLVMSTREAALRMISSDIHVFMILARTVIDPSRLTWSPSNRLSFSSV